MRTAKSNARSEMIRDGMRTGPSRNRPRKNTRETRDSVEKRGRICPDATCPIRDLLRSHQPSTINHQPSAMTKITHVVAASLAVATLSAQPTPDREMLTKIRIEGFERSQVRPVFDYLTIDIGPRLTASPAHKRAAQWTRDRLPSSRLSNPHLHPGKFSRGWEMKKLTFQMTQPRYLPLIAYPD